MREVKNRPLFLTVNFKEKRSKVNLNMYVKNKLRKVGVPSDEFLEPKFQWN